MKKGMLVLFVLVLLVGVVGAAVGDDAVGWWKFDGDATDSAGGNDGSCANCPSYVDDVEMGWVGNFDGTNDRVGISDDGSLDFGVGDFAVSLWVRVDGHTSQGSAWNTLIAKGLISGTDSPYWSIYIGADNKVYFSVGNHDNNAISDSALDDGGFHHIVARRVSGAVTLYIDNVLQANAGTSNNDIDNAVDLTIGADTSTNRFFDGAIDDVMVFDMALSVDDIGEIYDSFCFSDDRIMRLYSSSNSHGELWNNGDYSLDVCYNDIFGVSYTGSNPHDCGAGTIPSNKVVGLFSDGNSHAEIPILNDYDVDVCYGDLVCVARDNVCLADEEIVLSLYSDSNSHMSDSNYVPVGVVSLWGLDGDAVDSEGGNDGTINGAVETDGQVGKALEFDGSSYVEMPDLVSQLNANFVTMSAWIYPTAVSSDGNSNVFFIGDGTSGKDIAMWIGSGLEFLCRADDDGYPGEAFYSDTGVIELNEWQFVACSFDAVNNKVIGFVNDVKVIDDTTSYDIPIGNTDLTQIGRLADSVGSYDERYFYGKIDEVAVFDRALSEKEILNWYSVGAYEKKICCKDGGGVPVFSVREWRDMMGNVIADAHKGDTVRMVMTNSNVGTFEVFEEDDGFWGYILGGDDFIKSVDGVPVESDLVGEWVITQADLDLTQDYGEFKFEVEGDVSGNLTIDLTEDDDPMNVTIVAPTCGEDIDEDTAVTINISAVDKDDLINGTVTIGGSVVPFSNGGVVFDYDFNVSGNHQIVVEANNTRGERSRSIASVMVLDMEGVSYVDGTYVAACIDEPEDYSDITETNVRFDASSTRGIKVVGGVKDYILPQEDDEGRLSFYWNFLPDGLTRGDNYTGTSAAYHFGVAFADAGRKEAKLRVEVN